ncbi:MAG: hypothetical protein A2Y95_03955 [Deltaproteobacteria bacterium RBG_13_65_10]|nr:MAG: hypothetical protein A2Y95_03955 [Deltaproteobacteria bacterium RBG_13_65_10]
MKRSSVPLTLVTAAICVSLAVTAFAATKVDVNTVPRVLPSDLNVSAGRHNLSGGGSGIGNTATDQVCVFCHTPHFSNADANAIDAPLWNRNTSGATYTPYSSGTMDTTPGNPDGGSIACLSCHDGTVALDSLVNAPGRDGVNGYALGGTENAAFTNDPTFSLNWDFTDNGNPMSKPATLLELGSARIIIGTDLSNDHPISMAYPTAALDPGFNQPPGTPGGPRVFENGIRTFAGDKVQCGSCHEPHVSSSGKPWFAMYLRLSNQQSAMCLTCHIK